jgi:predicted patatin/cPLA2 family phospholipase
MLDACLVLEGGGLRGGFTGGVLEYLMEQGVSFERVVGVSAGACIGASYVSGQKGRNRKVNVEYPSDRRYMGFRHLLTTGSWFNMKFVFGELPKKIVPFDETAFYDSPVGFDVVATSLESGRPMVFDKEDCSNIGLDNVLVASSSLPLLSRPVEIGGSLYLDGGVSDSIPVEYALGLHRKAVLVATRPRGYRKGPLRFRGFMKLAFRKYPAFLETLLGRNEKYNRTMDFCERMEKEGRLFILAPHPEYRVGRLEPSLEKREVLYNHGYSLMQQEFNRLLEFAGGETSR